MGLRKHIPDTSEKVVPVSPKVLANVASPRVLTNVASPRVNSSPVRSPRHSPKKVTKKAGQPQTTIEAEESKTVSTHHMVLTKDVSPRANSSPRQSTRHSPKKAIRTTEHPQSTTELEPPKSVRVPESKRAEKGTLAVKTVEQTSNPTPRVNKFLSKMRGPSPRVGAGANRSFRNPSPRVNGASSYRSCAPSPLNKAQIK